MGAELPPSPGSESVGDLEDTNALNNRACNNNRQGNLGEHISNSLNHRSQPEAGGGGRGGAREESQGHAGRKGKGGGRRARRCRQLMAAVLSLSRTLERSIKAHGPRVAAHAHGGLEGNTSAVKEPRREQHQNGHPLWRGWGEATRVGEAANPGPGQERREAKAFTTTTINMTSWRARAQEVMALGSDIILVQETRIGE